MLECPNCHNEIDRKEIIGLFNLQCPHCKIALRKKVLHTFLMLLVYYWGGELLSECLRQFITVTNVDMFTTICQFTLFFIDMGFLIFLFPQYCKIKLGKLVIVEKDK